MRVILLSDLHIKPNSKAETLPWVKHFCDFMKSKYCSKTLVFVLGDVIDKGSQNKGMAFDAAEQIFSYIASELSSVCYQIAFIPGNHDYCDGNLDEFTQFCCKHQTCGKTIFDFSQKEAWDHSFDNINFILVDSVQNGNYRIPGSLNISSIRDCLKTDKINIMLMHHSLIFEDSETHTGILNQKEAIDFIWRCNIRFVFHGHAHATRDIHIDKRFMHYGIGSMGLEVTDPTDLLNEQEQFFEVKTNRQSIEAIVNWLWRGGVRKYEKILFYPESDNQYENGEFILRKEYTMPENYIARHVMPRDLASGDALTRYLNAENEITLFEACQKNEHVLFVADAGLGKTFEMEYLAHTVSTKNPYMRPILLPLNIYDSAPIQTYIDLFVPEYKTLDPEQFLLIMDGYDELAQPDAFKRALSQYMVNNRNTHICISMRSNFFSSNSSAFQDFSVYQLLELENMDIQRELQKSGIDEPAFRDECYRKNLLNLLQNPFYLGKLITIYLSDGFLPNQAKLMDRLVEEQFSKDAAKFEYTLETSLEDCQYELEHALIRFAYGMQLLNASAWDKETYQAILGKDDRQYIRCSSSTINTHYGHRFSHNIFKEYLIAKYLSRTSYANILKHILIPETKYLNPNWFNILGFILQLNPHVELIEWLTEVEPMALTKIETDSVSNELRYSILESTLSSIVCKNIWFQNEVCSETHLATFSQSLRAVDLLISHIKAPAHFRSLYFCLTVLSNFSELYGKDDRVRQVLIDCYQSYVVRAHEKRVAISAIAALQIATPEITEDLVTRFATSETPYERIGVYEYLLQVKKTNENVDFLLAGIKNISYSHEKNKVSDGTEHFKLMDCLSSIDESCAIERIISWYSCKSNMNIDFYDSKKLFSGFIDKATERYNSGYPSLFETVYTFFVNATRNYSQHHIPDALRFFTQTGTMEIAFERLVCEEAEDCIFIIEDTIHTQPDLIDLLCHLYVQNKLQNPNLFKQFALRCYRTENLFQKCADAIKQKTGKVLTPPPAPVDYEQQHRNDTQAFFNSLFDRSAMSELIIELVNLYGNSDMTFKQLLDTRIWRKNYPIGTQALEVTLIQSGFKKERILDFIDLINWDSFFINRICYLFNNEKAITFLIISDEQKEVLYETYHQLEENLDLHAAIEELETNSYRISLDVQCYMILKNALKLLSPNSYYLGLLEIPYHFINKLSRVEEKYELIEKYILPGDIAKQIAVLVPKETRVSVLEDLMFGCKRYRIKSCKDAAMQMCQMNTVAAYTRRNALEYLLDIFGLDLILNELMPSADNSLFELIVDMLRSDEDERLKSEILCRYKRYPSHFLIKKLIVLNVSEGLHAYIDASRTAGRIMDNTDGIGEITKAISSVHDIALLPMLLDAVRLRFTDAFTDGHFHSLYGSLQTALTTCAKSDFKRVWTAIENLKTELSSNLEAISFCNELQNSILENNKMSLVKKLTISEVKAILHTVE